jgi:hypothetical protein
MKKLWLIVALSLATLPGCKRDNGKGDNKNSTSSTAESLAKMSRLMKVLDAHATASLNKPEVEKAIDTLINEVFKDPGVARGAETLISKMTSDSTISKGYEYIVASLSESSAVQKMVKQVMVDNPGANAEAIGEIVGAQVEKLIEGPAFSNAIDRSMNILFARPEVSELFARIGPAMMTSPEAMQVFSSAVAPGVIDESTFSEQKLTSFYTEVFGLPDVNHALAGYLRNILAEPTVQNHLIQGTQELLNNEAFRSNAKDLMKLMFNEAPDSAGIDRAVRRLFEDPAVGQSISTLLQKIANDPAAKREGTVALAAIAKAPRFAEAVKRLMK